MGRGRSCKVAGQADDTICNRMRSQHSFHYTIAEREVCHPYGRGDSQKGVQGTSSSHMIICCSLLLFVIKSAQPGLEASDQIRDEGVACTHAVHHALIMVLSDLNMKLLQGMTPPRSRGSDALGQLLAARLDQVHVLSKCNGDGRLTELRARPSSFC